MSRAVHEVVDSRDRPGIFTTFRKVLELFERDEYPGFGLVLLAVTLTGLAETVGVASIMPFMTLVADPGAAAEMGWARWLREVLPATGEADFLFQVGVVVLLVLALSNIISICATWLELRFVWRKHASLSRRLLGSYVAQDYGFFVERNSADLSKTLLAEVDSVTNGVLIPTMRVVAKGVVAFFLLALLCIVDLRLALTVAGFLAGCYGVLYLIIRQRQTRIGSKRLVLNGVRYRIAGEVFGGIKEVKALGREGEFLRRFEYPARGFADAAASNQIVQQWPKYALETVAFGGILAIVLYLLSARGDLQSTLPILSLYAFAGYRLMPSLQQVFQGLTQIRFSSPALDELHRDLREVGSGRWPRADDATDSEPVFEKTIDFDRATFRYPNADRPAVDQVSFSIHKNQTVGLAGPTGSGKTTIGDLLLGLYEPTGGSIRIDGKPRTNQDLSRWRSMVGYVALDTFLCDDTLERNVAFGLPDEEIEEARVWSALKLAHLDDLVRTLPSGLSTLIGERGVRLSGGQRQRIGIARALYHDPAILVFDEATSALDNLTEDAVMEAVRSLSGERTLIVIAHRLRTLRNCDRILVFDEGRLSASGTFESLMAADGTFNRMVVSGRASDPSASATGC